LSHFIPFFSDTVDYADQKGVTVAITDLGSFIDAMGIKNIVGSVENNNDVPVQMLIGLNTTSSNNSVPDSMSDQGIFLQLCWCRF
jgi:hypothetical protein